MKKKLHLGKKTLISLEFQINTILTYLNRTEIHIDKLKPVRHNNGNFVLVTYHKVSDPEVLCSQYCAHQKVGDCCDVWLESPPAHTDRITNTCAA